MVADLVLEVTGTPFFLDGRHRCDAEVTEDPEVREQDGNDEMAAFIMGYASISRDSEKLLMVLSVESAILASAVNNLSDPGVTCSISSGFAQEYWIFGFRTDFPVSVQFVARQRIQIHASVFGISHIFSAHVFSDPEVDSRPLPQSCQQFRQPTRGYLRVRTAVSAAISACKLASLLSGLISWYSFFGYQCCVACIRVFSALL